MKKLKDYFRSRGFKTAPESLKGPLHKEPNVVLLYHDSKELEVVTRYFKHTTGITTVPIKRSKEKALKSTQLHTNDFDFRGVPRSVFKGGSDENEMLINLRKDLKLDWYWYGRNYNYRVDLQGTCELADITISGPFTLAEKLDTLKQYLEKLKS